jgi:hypothetical protein
LLPVTVTSTACPAWPPAGKTVSNWGACGAARTVVPASNARRLAVNAAAKRHFVQSYMFLGGLIASRSAPKGRSGQSQPPFQGKVLKVRGRPIDACQYDTRSCDNKQLRTSIGQSLVREKIKLRTGSQSAFRPVHPSAQYLQPV